MGQVKWLYTAMYEGVEQFVCLSEKGRRKITENPDSPEKELESFLESKPIEVLLLAPCSSVTFMKAESLASTVIVIDYDLDRLKIFMDHVPRARTEHVNDVDSLRKVLSGYSKNLEQGQIRTFISERFARLDSKLKNLLQKEVLILQKEAASFAVNRSLKRWHTNTNLFLNLKSVKTVLTDFTCTSKPHVIVGAGPSLDINIDVLKRYSDKAIIVATDGSVKSLVNNGIIPDAIVSKEDTLMSWRFVAGIEDSLVDVPLYIDLKANNYLATCYPGPVIMTRSSSYENWLQPVADNFVTLEKGSCVGHMAFNFAIASGASEIIMVGFDLAFRNDIFHPKDMPVPYFHGMVEPELDFVEGQNGERLKTDISMKVYLRHFEEIISFAKAPVIDATEGGALKKGAIIKILNDALENKVTLSKKASFQSRPLDKNLLDIALMSQSGTEFQEAFTSYLVQTGESYSELEKQEDWLATEKYLNVLKQCPIQKGINEAAFVTEDADPEFLKWLDSRGICIYMPESLTDALQLCLELDLSGIYCCNGKIYPDLLLLTEVNIWDIKTKKELLHYERCLWSPSYKVLCSPEDQSYWRGSLPDDILVESISLLIEEVEYGVS